MKITELEGSLLDYWVARALGAETLRTDNRLTEVLDPRLGFGGGSWQAYCPSVDWGHGGPIIEREGICVVKFETCWGAQTGFENWIDTNDDDIEYTGPTPLVAAMRAYVASKFKEEVGDVPANHRAPFGLMR